MNHKNPAIAETVKLSIGMAVVLVLMLLIYALLGFFSIAVLKGSMIGTLLAIGNFFFMAISMYNLSVEQNAKAQFKASSGYTLRLLALGGLLFVAIKFGGCDPLASVIPLLAVRLVITVEQFIFNAGKADQQPVKAEEEEHGL